MDVPEQLLLIGFDIRWDAGKNIETDEAKTETSIVTNILLTPF